MSRSARSADGIAPALGGGTMSVDAGLLERVKAASRELGFARCGVARAEPLGVEAERLRAWLAAGYHGGMDYMPRTEAVRADPTHAGMLASARSVVVLVAPYARGAAAAPAAGQARVARYARGRDYHDVLHDRMRPLVQLLRAEGHEARAAVDSMPVFERAWAARAGVGFVGKNCCVIVPGLGSHVFLAAIVTSAPLPEDAPMAERCGECRLCLDRCPTRAFVSARVLDARRCVSYLTIEHRGAIDPELRPGIADWLFGCDACQDVCPFNRGAAEPHLLPEFVAGGVDALDPERVLSWTDAEFRAATRRSPLRRARREGLARNAAITLGNARARRSLPVLHQAAESDPSEVVRDAARWAADRIAEDGEPHG
jgi:epoxyqueuosine reductase